MFLGSTYREGCKGDNREWDAPTPSCLHLVLVHDVHKLQLAFGYLYYFLNESGTNGVFEFGDPKTW